MSGEQGLGTFSSSRRKRRTIAFAIATTLLVVLAAPSARAQLGPPDLVLIADSSDFPDFFSFGTPVVNEDGVVAFYVARNPASGFVTEILAGVGGEATPGDYAHILGSGDSLPDGTVLYVSSWMDAAGPLFALSGATTGQFSGQTLTASDIDANGIYDLTLRSPFGTSAISAWGSVNRNGAVGYRGAACGVEPGVAWNDGTGERVAACQGSGNVSSLDQGLPDIDGSNRLYFTGRLPGTDPSSDTFNALSIFRDGDPIFIEAQLWFPPDLGPPVLVRTHYLNSQVRPVSDASGTVAFVAERAGTGVVELLTTDGGALTVKASTSTGDFGGFGRHLALNDFGTVAFLGCATTCGSAPTTLSTTLGGGLYTGPDAVDDKIIEIGDALFGSTVTALAFARGGLNDFDEIAFLATLEDGRRVIVRADPQAPPPLQWENPAGGNWGDSANWQNDSVPDERAEVAAPGSYTISGVPSSPLLSLAIGSPTGTVTLQPGAGVFETQTLGVNGDVALLGGALEAGFDELAGGNREAIEISSGARLTVGSGATLRAGPDVVDPGSVGGPMGVDGGSVLLDDASGLRVEGGGKAIARDVHGFGASVEVTGPGSRLSTRILELGFGGGAVGDLAVTGGGELRVGDSLLLGSLQGSSVTGLVAGAGSGILGLRGDLLDTGPLEVVIGSSGDADLVVDAADLLLGRELVLGQQSGSFGLLAVRNGGGLYASPTEVTDITIGRAGIGELRIDSGGFLGFLGLAIGGPLPEMTIGLAPGGSGLFDLAGDADPATNTRFENVIVGLSGESTWLLHDEAQVEASSLSLAVDSGTSLARVDVAGAGTELRVADGNGTQIGGDGDAWLEVRDGARFISGRSDPNSVIDPDPAALTSVGSDSSSYAATLIVRGNARAELDLLSIGLFSGDPVLSSLPFDRSATVLIENGGQLFTTRAIVVGNSGRIRANIAEIEADSLVIAPAGDAGPGAHVSLSTSSMRVTEGISIGVEVASNPLLGILLLVDEGSNVLAGGLDVRGAATVVIDESFVRIEGPVGIAAQAPILAGGSTCDALVTVGVQGTDGVLDASGHTVRIGGATNCQDEGNLFVLDGGLVIADLFEIEPGGVLFGSSRIRGSLSVSAGGIVRPGNSPGMLTIEGDAHFAPGSRLEIEVAGTEAGTLHDVLDVQGDLDFDGTLTLAFTDGFAPRQGDHFEFLQTTGALALDVEEVVVENLAPGFEYDVDSTADRITVIALNDAVFVPEPGYSEVVLPALAMLGVLARRRRLGSPQAS